MAFTHLYRPFFSFLSTREAGERIKVRGASMTGEISKMSFFPAISPSPSSG
jgi:hypothetical protein